MSPEGCTRQRTPRSTRGLLSKSPSQRMASPATPRRPTTPRRHRPTPKPIELFHKCYSEPINFREDGEGDGDRVVGGCGSLESDEGGWFNRVNTLDDLLLCTDISEIIASPLPRSNAGYKKDSKVLITVAVEGSPGPIKTLVKLGASVDDTIKLVVQKYGEEGRTPRLDKDAASSTSYDLHVSYFSLQSLDKSNAIGDLGTRSFYLRKTSNNGHGLGNKPEEPTTTTVTNSSDSERNVQGSSLSKHPSVPVLVLPPFVAPKVQKFVRRMHRVFILLGCLHSR